MNIQKIFECHYNKFIDSESSVRDFIDHDPVQFPRRYAKQRPKNQADVEIAAFLAATIAWGRRDLIIRSARMMFAMMEPEGPYAYVLKHAGHRRCATRPKSAALQKNATLQKSAPSRGSCLHRTFFERDLQYFCNGFKHCYAKYGTLEKLFASQSDVWQGIGLFREEMAAGNNGLYTPHIANPDANSACKRINLALRWLVRKGPVDIGLWKKIKPSSLYIPLDVHVARNARNTGLLERKSNDKKAVIEITEKLRQFCPEDPVKYDFVLFSIG
jgi:uncharacterized protein (TIGR02757 family)